MSLKPAKITFVTTMGGAPWGGSEELWGQTASRLRSAGHRVSACVGVMQRHAPKVTALARQGIGLRFRSESLVAKVGKKIQMKMGQATNDFVWLRRQKPDLTVISEGSIGEGRKWMKYCRDEGLPFVAIVHCNSEQWGPSDVVGDEMTAAYGAAIKVFCVSRGNLQLLERQLAHRFSNIGLVWNPYNVPVQDPPPWPSANGVWKLACVARLDPKAKGQDLLFQVCSQTKWRERPIKVNMYGAGPCESSLKRLAGMLQANNVQFCGHVADISKIWAENHMLVLPSRLEGLPLALVESMWCARPSVVTDVGGNAELCVDGETGFVAAAPTLGLFDETLERAWTRRDHWQVMGCAARARAEKLIPKAPIEEFCRQLMECLERHKTT